MLIDRLVVATGNAGKLRELSALLADSGIEIVSQKTLGIDDAEETGQSFIENAILKARHAARLSGMAALADDSGLAVDALSGAPGIHSARYAGAHAGDEANNRKLIAALSALPAQTFHGRFHCVMALMRHEHDPCPLIAHGTWEGEILLSPRGDNGFGYDPLFWLPDLKCTAAELSADIKNRLSHRAQALAALCRQLQKAE